MKLLIFMCFIISICLPCNIPHICLIFNFVNILDCNLRNWWLRDWWWLFLSFSYLGDSILTFLVKIDTLLIAFKNGSLQKYYEGKGIHPHLPFNFIGCQKQIVPFSRFEQEGLCALPGTLEPRLVLARARQDFLESVQLLLITFALFFYNKIALVEV